MDLTALSKTSLGFFAVLLLSACSVLPGQTSDCIGQVNQPPSGLVEIEDSQLLAEAIGQVGTGKLCTGKVYQVQEPVTVYRVWNQAKAYSAYGSWWSLSEPQGPRAKYRRENDICPSWSSLDMVSACRLKVGAKVVIGPGQSVRCEQASVTYPQSAINQMFVPNDSRNDVLWVENCDAAQSWP